MKFVKSMPKLRTILLAVVCLMLFSWMAPMSGYAGDYYVDASAESEGDGSSGSPWKTLHNAITQLNSFSSGTYTLHVASGTYNVANGESGLMEDNPLTITQDSLTITGADSQNKPVIDGQGGGSWTDGFQIIASNVVIKDLVLKNFIAASSGIEIYGSSNTIQYCDINNNNYGVHIEAASTDNTIEWCNIHNNNYGVYLQSAGSGNTIDNCQIYSNGDGVYVYQSISPTVQGCEIYNNTSDGISIEDSTGGIITKNTIYNNVGTNSDGIKIDGSSPEVSRNKLYDNRFNISVDAVSGKTASPTIKNNLIYEVAYNKVSFGIIIGGGGSVSPKIYHNTIDGGQYQGILIAEVTNTPDIEFNIITNCRQSGIQDSGNPTYNYNDVWHNGPYPYTTNYVGCSAGADSISADPQYVSYQLQSTSPCINAIPDTTPPNDPVTDDMDGTARPYGSGYDMGCYEYTGLLPAVTTTTVSSITTTTASSGGKVISEGGASVDARGVCWSTSANPTTSDSKTTDGTGIGTFTSSITGLTPGTTYHVRAYATNGNGTSYGIDRNFTTTVLTYYVDITAGTDDTSHGTSSGSGAWKTIHYAITQINAGVNGNYILYVAAGDYKVSSNSGGELDAEMILSQSNVTIYGADRTNTKINGNGAEGWSKGLEITGSNNVVKNLSVTGFSGTNEEGIRISGGMTNEVKGCRVYGNNFGIRISESTESKVQGCQIFENSTHGIDVIFSTGTTIVENVIYGNPQYGIRAQCSPEISRNEIYNNSYGILVYADGSETASPTIKNNVIYKNPSASGTMNYGISMISAISSSAVVNPKIYHNTIDSGTDTGILISGLGYNTPMPIIKYNIITNFGEVGIHNTGGNPTIIYNDVWNNLLNYQGFEVIPPDNMSQDPLYGSYELLIDSPCRDAISVAAEDPVNIDYPGYKRPQGTGWDMGAYEYIDPELFSYTPHVGTGVASDYRIFTVPLKIGTGTGANLLSNMQELNPSLFPYNLSVWRAFGFNGVGYIEFNDPDYFPPFPVEPGVAFWIITNSTNQIRFQGKPAPMGVPYEMALKPGWSLIGLPWISPDINLDNIKVTDGVNTYFITDEGNNLTQQFVWDYTGCSGSPPSCYSGYERKGVATTLPCGTGYFMKVVTNKDVKVIIPPENTNNFRFMSSSDAQRQESERIRDDAPPAPPGGPTEFTPVPDIKANGQDGPLIVPLGDPVSVTITLDPDSDVGQKADWWVLLHTSFAPPDDWFSYVSRLDWKPGMQVAAQAPLFMLRRPFEVLNVVLPTGNYVFYFGVDANTDGIVDGTSFDSVEVRVQ